MFFSTEETQETSERQMIPATKVLDVGLFQYVVWNKVCPREKTTSRAQLFRSKAKNSSKE